MLTACQIEDPPLDCDEGLFRCIVSAAKDAIVVMDCEGKIAFWNVAAETVFGYRESEVLHRDFHQLLAQERYQVSSAEAVRCFLHTGEGAAIGSAVELCAKRKDGVEIPVELSLSALRRGDVWYAVAVVRNTEERARARVLAAQHEQMEALVQERSAELLEAQRQVLQGEKLASVGRLAAGIAHEINTPIQFVGDNLQALSEFLEDLKAVVTEYRAAVDRAIETNELADLGECVKAAEQKHDLAFVLEDAPKAVAQAQEGVQRVAQIVRAMKDFSHIKGGASSGVDINRCLQSTLTVAKNEYKYHADLRAEFGDLPLVECYPGELNQVFLNLLINGVHAIQDTGQRGVITISTRLDGEEVEVVISDTGKGIPEAIRSKIFEPFFTTKEVGKGTGQGLFISRQVVVGKHGGSLTFESELGKGTAFRIRIPIRLASTDADKELTEDGQDTDSVR